MAGAHDTERSLELFEEQTMVSLAGRHVETVSEAGTANLAPCLAHQPEVVLSRGTISGAGMVNLTQSGDENWPSLRWPLPVAWKQTCRNGSDFHGSCERTPLLEGGKHGCGRRPRDESSHSYGAAGLCTGDWCEGRKLPRDRKSGGGDPALLSEVEWPGGNKQPGEKISGNNYPLCVHSSRGQKRARSAKVWVMMLASLTVSWAVLALVWITVIECRPGWVGAAQSEQGAKGDQGRKPVRLFAEAEDFRVTSPGWEVVPYRENYFACTFAITFLSRMAALGAPEQLPPGQVAVAEQDIQIPYGDTYELLVRYEQPYNFSCEFTIEIEQHGKVVGRFLCGRLTDPKIWAFNNHKREPMVRYTWSGTDNIVWQHPGAVKLSGGSAKLRLLATAQLDEGRPRRNAARRHVDVICLTNDRDGMERQKKAGYLEFDGWLVQDGDLFVRITNPADAPAPVLVVLPPMQAQHSPYYVHVRDWPTTTVLKSGRAVSATNYQLAGPRSQQVRPELLAPLVELPKVIPPEQYLQPGDRSGWVPIGQSCDALNYGQWWAEVRYPPKTPNAPPAGSMYLRWEFGIPDGQGGIRVIKDITIRCDGKDRTEFGFDIPGCINPNPTLAAILKQRYWLPEIRTQKEALRWLLEQVRKFPQVGRVPERLLIYGIEAGNTEEGRQLGLALGDNTRYRGQGKKRGMITHWPNPDLKWIEQQVAKRPGGLEDVLIVSYGDEISPARRQDHRPGTGRLAQGSRCGLRWPRSGRQRPVASAVLLLATGGQRERRRSLCRGHRVLQKQRGADRRELLTARQLPGQRAGLYPHVQAAGDEHALDGRLCLADSGVQPASRGVSIERFASRSQIRSPAHSHVRHAAFAGPDSQRVPPEFLLFHRPRGQNDQLLHRHAFSRRLHGKLRGHLRPGYVADDPPLHA
jgi:hypothetical protein